MDILSIDAWRQPEGGWNWNNWHRVDEITKEDFEKLKTNRQILRDARERGLIGKQSAGKVSVEDDQYNIVICARGTGEPLYAYVYGPEYI